MKTLWKCCVSLRLNSLTLGTLDLVARAILQLSLGHWGTVCMAAFRSRGLPNLPIRFYFDLVWKHVTACARRDSCRSHPATSIGDDSSALSWQGCGKYVFQGEDEANHVVVSFTKYFCRVLYRFFDPSLYLAWSWLCQRYPHEYSWSSAMSIKSWVTLKYHKYCLS